jgi:hypothetical protein
LLQFITGLGALTFTVSILGWPIAKLLRADRGKRLFKRAAGISILVTILFALASNHFEQPGSANKPNENSSSTAPLATTNTAAPTRTVAADNGGCEAGNPTGKEYKVTGQSIPARMGPGLNFDQVVDPKATAALGKTQYAEIEASFAVKEVCRSGVWSKIETITPTWLADTRKGWIESKHLITAEQRAAKGFVEDDFIFSKEAKPWKKIIIEGVNRIARQDNRCKEIDPGTADITPDGTKTNPQFFVTCDPSGPAFNVFFTKADIDKGRTFEAPTWIDHQMAAEACEAAAKASAVHPSTVDFSRFMDLAVQDFADGRTEVRSTFTAKNSFNLELKYDIACRFNATGFVGQPEITEGR